MFAKTNMLHKLFNNRRVSQAKAITDQDLLPRIVIPILALVALSVGVWQRANPRVLTEVTSDDSRWKFTACRSVNQSGSYLGALVGLEGAFLLFVAYLSYKVRTLPSDFNGGWCVCVSRFFYSGLIALTFNRILINRPLRLHFFHVGGANRARALRPR